MSISFCQEYLPGMAFRPTRKGTVPWPLISATLCSQNRIHTQKKMFTRSEFRVFPSSNIEFPLCDSAAFSNCFVLFLVYRYFFLVGKFEMIHLVAIILQSYCNIFIWIVNQVILTSSYLYSKYNAFMKSSDKIRYLMLAYINRIIEQEEWFRAHLK